MRTLRHCLSLPLFWLAALLSLIFIGLGKTFQALDKYLIGGTAKHVYWPILAAARYVRGLPSWSPIDFKIGVPPQTKAQRAHALDQGFEPHPCVCGRPTCKRETWVMKPPPGLIEEMQRAAKESTAAFLARLNELEARQTSTERTDAPGRSGDPDRP